MEKKNFKKMGRGVYISLAICMLVIAGVGIFASVRSVSNIMNENLETLDELSDVGEFDFSLPTSDVPIKDELDEEEKIKESEKVSVEPVVYGEPLKNGEVLKRFSNGELVFSETMNDYRTHNGIDILAENADAVVSVADGTIVKAELDALWGMTVSVDHGNGIVSVYKNLSETLPEGIESGAFVSSGGVIGAVSTSALVEIGEKPHLHLEVFSNGVAVDPIETLKIYE